MKKTISILDPQKHDTYKFEIDETQTCGDIITKFVVETKKKRRDRADPLYGFQLANIKTGKVYNNDVILYDIADENVIYSVRTDILKPEIKRVSLVKKIIVCVSVVALYFAINLLLSMLANIRLGWILTLAFFYLPKVIIDKMEENEALASAEHKRYLERVSKKASKQVRNVNQIQSSVVTVKDSGQKSADNGETCICSKCNKSIPSDSEFCPYCGSEIVAETSKYLCSKCNREIPEDSEFCPFCGNKIVAEVSENKCVSCGKVIPEDSEFCPFCGASTGVNRPSITIPEEYKNKNGISKIHPEFLDYEPDDERIITIVRYAAMGILGLFVILYWALAHKMMPGSGTSQLLIYILSALVFTGACAYGALNIYKKDIFSVNAILGGTATVFIILMVSFNIAYSYKSADYVSRVNWDKAPVRVSIDANYYSDEIKKVHNASVKMRLGDKGASWFNDNDVVKINAGEQYDVYLKCGYSKSKVEKNVGLVRITKNDIINGGTMNYDVKIDDFVSAGVIVYYELDDSFWRVVFS